ncbi:MAG TPA: WYL domain-containing protein [Myxococcota bacterium]|nr:WYL domain-containing protein [Myxococcales bacterium]HPG24296.1 WYL domain-containing protein [Myxococcota bacterium]
MRGDQLARQWLLMQRLARSRAGVGLDELAEELGCVRRTVYRDLDALMYAGFPVTSEKRDGKAYYRFLDTFQMGQVPFTPDELLALAMGGDLLRTLEGTVFHDSIRAALAKIRAGLGPELTAYLERLGDAFRVLPGPHKRYADLGDTIRTLNDAVLGSRSVELRYRTARRGVESDRRLDPYKVWYHAGSLYVIGHDHLSGEIRTFAVDRILSIEASDEAFEVATDFDFDAYIASSFGVIAEPAVPVRIRFDAEWAAYVSEREWHASQSIETRDDGGILLAMEVGPSHELANWILSFGGGAEVLEPEALRDEVRAALEAALAHYA